MIKCNEKGYTLIEVIGVLGIIGVLAASMGMLASSMFGKYRMNRVSDQIIDLQKNINRRFVADGSYAQVSEAKLISENVVGKDMIRGNTIVHAFGDVNIIPGALSFKIRFKTLPYNVCVQLSTLNWIIQDSSDLVSLRVNATTYFWPEAAPNAATQLPLDIVRAATSCVRGDINEIIWEFQ